MNASAREKAASSLLDAVRDRVPIAALTETYDEVSIDDAYAIQLQQIEARTTQGRRVLGHKVGLTSAVVQRQLGVDQPDYGHLLDDMFYLDSSPIPMDRFISPRIEPEIAIVLNKELSGPGVTTAEAIAAVDFVLPALEVIDSRIRDWKIAFEDTVADNASSGAVVLGNHPTRLHDVDLSLVGCLLSRQGNVIATGAGGAVLGSPINVLVWLANTLGRREVALKAGHIIMPGAVTGAVPVTSGDTVTATFGDLGSVTTQFIKENS